MAASRSTLERTEFAHQLVQLCQSRAGGGQTFVQPFHAIASASTLRRKDSSTDERSITSTSYGIVLSSRASRIRANVPGSKGAPGKMAMSMSDAGADEDVEGALAAVAEGLRAPLHCGSVATFDPTARPAGPLDASTLATVVAATLPEGAVVVDEGAASSVLLVSSAGIGDTPHVAHVDWRRHRPGPAVRDRRRNRVPGPQSRGVSGRRQRPLYAPGALDSGARVARRHDHHPRESHLSYSSDRADAGGRRRTPPRRPHTDRSE